MSLATRVKKAWNAFINRDEEEQSSGYYGYSNLGSGMSYANPPFRSRLRGFNEKSFVTAIYNRIAVDVSQIDIEHVRVDENGRYQEQIDSGLNYCLTQEANIDQTGKNLIQDAVMSMFDEGVVAIAPIDTMGDPRLNSYDIRTLRVGRILNWYPRHVLVELYDDRDGQKKPILLPKSIVAIVQNPFYTVMNEPNSTLQRLIHKLNLLDYVDDQSSSGKLDLIIQLPYQIKTDLQKERAQDRKKDIEDQLQNSKYGIAYIDASEHVTQLNRPVNNNLLDQIADLTDKLYSQLGITPEIMNGTAPEAVMKNYYKRTINPIVEALADEMKRKFLTKTARSQGQSILYFNDVFGLIPASELAELADKFTRNEIATSNEIRGVIGFKPSKDPKADELRNSNLNQSSDAATQPVDVDGNPLPIAGGSEPIDATAQDSTQDMTGDETEETDEDPYPDEDIIEILLNHTGENQNESTP